jgi:hypothetical protein
MSSTSPKSSPAATSETLSPRSQIVSDILNKLAIVGLLAQIYFYSVLLVISAVHFIIYLSITIDRLQYACEFLLELLNLPQTTTKTMVLAFIALTLVGFSDLVLWLLSFVIGRMMRYVEGGFRAGRSWDERRQGRLGVMPLAPLMSLYRDVWRLLNQVRSRWEGQRVKRRDSVSIVVSVSGASSGMRRSVATAVDHWAGAEKH